MVSFILEMIGAPVLKHILPIIIAAFLCYLGFQIGLQKREEILGYPREYFELIDKTNYCEKR